MPNAIKNTSVYPNIGLSRIGSQDNSFISLEPGGGIGPTGNIYGWYNGIVPLPGKYIVYINDSTPTGFDAGPRIYAPQSDAELIRLALSYNIPATTAAEALYGLAENIGTFVVNKSYPNIVTDKLVYLIDSTFAASYPTTGTQTFPIQDSKEVGNGILQNGVGWDSNNMSFIFDGSDDQIPLFGSDNFNQIDFSTGFTLMVLYKIDAVTDFNSQFRCMFGVTGGGRTWNYYLYGPSTPATTLLYHFSGQMSNGLSSAVTVTPDTYHLGAFTIAPGTEVGTYYHDGAVVSTQTAASSPSYTTAGGIQYLGRGDNMWKGNIARLMIYNKALTQAEILQNYYQGNIVTSNLIVNLDASNLSSYPGSGAVWYDISGNGNNFTLYNGVGFSSQNGGCLTFDGVNDYAASTNNLNLTSYDYIAVEVFYKANSSVVSMLFEHTADWNSNPGGFGLATNSDGSSTVVNCNHTNHNTEVARNYLVTNNSIWSNNLNLYSKISDPTGRLTYVNGELVDFSNINGYSTGTATSSGGQFANAIFYIGSRGGSIIPFNGNISSLKIYGFKINASQVKQNFSALSSKFM